MTKNETNQADSATSPDSNRSGPNLRGWLKVGTVAAASALIGGLAAAWYYRKTIQTLQEAESSDENPEFRIPEYEIDSEI